MKIEQAKFADHRWVPEPPGKLGSQAQLVFVFGSTALMKDTSLAEQVRAAFPNACLFGCSTAGEICGTEVSDETLVATAVAFEHTGIESICVSAQENGGSFEAGRSIAQQLQRPDLRHVLVFSEGLQVNGSELVRGISGVLGPSVMVSGGLSGDGARFEETYVLWNSSCKRGQVAAVGLYGPSIKVSCASLGGWDVFGPTRVVTRSQGNVLYQLDGAPALELYKKYLGEHANALPASGLLFPLSIRTEGSETAIVRTILAVNETEGSITFAGDIPQGAFAQLMMANFDRLVDGASGAAEICRDALQQDSPALALLISCVGRKLVLKQRIEDEVEAVRDVFGSKTALTGFYSYGEISPFTPDARCELHNQTMTITTLSET